ncbi:MAG: ComEC/Rec2 family competence protein [Muribaculaceae bacterium]|nr:ComEC/Rec2 family competence protein [Muribaculaceae bacterium]
MLKPILILSAAVVGVLIGFATGSSWPVAGFVAAAIVVWLTAFMLLRKDRTRFQSYSRLHSVWPCLLCAGLGAMSAYWNSPGPEALPLYVECGIFGRVEDSRSLTTADLLTVRLYSVTPSGGHEIECRNISVLLYAGGDVQLLPGDEIAYHSVLLPNAAAAPGRPAYVSHDMVRIYRNDAEAAASGGKKQYRLKPGGLRIVGHKDNVATLMWQWRNRIAISLENSSLSAASAGMLRALLTGVRSGIKEDESGVFRDGGVAHTLAVSGLHVGIIAALLSWLTMPLNLLRSRRLRLVAVCAGIWIFTLFTGLMYSTLRAALMFTFGIVGRETGRRSSPLHGVCMAAFLIILVWPEALWDAGFQLSFLCVAALIVFVEPLNPISHRHHPVTYKMVSALLVTLVATGATWMVSARYFGSVPMNFMLCNIIVLPVIPVIMSAGMAYVVILMCGTDFILLGRLIDGAIRMIYSILDRFSVHVIDIEPSLISVSLWFSGIVMLAIALHYHRPAARTLPGAMVLPVSRTPEDTVPLHRPTLIAAILLFLLSLIVI